MASFFQPGFNDPAIEGCERSSRFEVLCNSILPADRRFAQWHQVLDVTVGVTAIVIPILLFLLYRVARPKHDAAARSKHARYSRDVSRPVSEHQGPAPSFRATKTFRVLDDFTDLPISGDTQPFSDEDLTSPQLEATAARLHEAYMEQTLAGFAVRCSSHTEAAKVERLLEALHARKLPALLLCHHDFAGLDALSFFHASGLIMENACILRDGTRRDYFIARRLRDTMTRCTAEREDRPEFFVAFLDQWDVRPHPSVVKRAVKIAEHFGAVIEHGPSDVAMGASPVVASASRTIGGFEYLRRAEIIQPIPTITKA
ncbi:hypothetical protein VdG2_06477 [Verticillium dahliae VDG2]|nr:hypothetical protein VdG2_06477 [Verticillium dahliae VDG2]